MKLLKIIIENFRSIEKISFDIKDTEESFTYTLIGINETGKSSFLEAVSLVDIGTVLYPKDFYDDTKPINVFLTYQLEPEEEKGLKKELGDKGFEKELLSEIQIEEVDVCVSINTGNNQPKNTFDRIKFKNHIFDDYTLGQDAKPTKKNPEQVQDNLDIKKYFEIYLPKYFWKISHHITFWKSHDKYLINDQIDLNSFSEKPKDVSVPLLNCFGLAGIEDIKAEINKIKATNPADVNNLQEKLGDKVTSHIKKVWPNHPIKIRFQISGMMLSFLVEDDGVKYSSKTTNQRSDGFRQFISFLLTISAQYSTDQLSNSILLLDEPETHLHPQAQEYLRNELIKITKNKENNIVFFATHSNYMINKNHLDRCFRVLKQDNKKTKIEEIKGENTTYAEVNYEIFDIITSDYHNELYSKLHQIYQDKNQNDEKRERILNFDDNFLYKEKGLKKDKPYRGEQDKATLPTYVRNCIHHADKCGFYKDDELKKSIKLLRSYL